MFWFVLSLFIICEKSHAMGMENTECRPPQVMIPRCAYNIDFHKSFSGDMKFRQQQHKQLPFFWCREPIVGIPLYFQKEKWSLESNKKGGDLQLFIKCGGWKKGFGFYKKGCW